jgi:carboxymethylenebutenolidase
MPLRDYLAGEVAEDYADGFLTRREALRRLGLLGLGLTSASALLAACGGDDDTASTSRSTAKGADANTSGGAPPVGTTPTSTGAPVASEEIEFAGGGDTQLQAAVAVPQQPKGAVLVIHENRGLTPHFQDLVSRLATNGYAALCVDLLSKQGGTASLQDPAAAPAALAQASVDDLVVDLEHGIDELQRRAPGAPVGVMGFCFGGAMTWELLQTGDRRPRAAVPFYGPAPESPDFSSANAAVLAIYAGLDDRVNATRDRAVEALQRAGLTYEVKTYPGVDHAFFNDTGPRYNRAAADDAYALTLSWFGAYLV